MPRALGYYRVSSQRQAGERNVSLDVQRERFHAHCAAHGYVLAGEFTDVASGRRDDRVEYQRMLEACRRGEADLVVAMFLDRFGRDADEIMLQVITLERQYHVTVECTDEDVRNRLMRYIGAWKAGAESERIGERTRAAIVRKLQAGEHWARVPYGWYKDPITKRLVIDRAEAAVILRMVDLMLDENLGRINVARRLNDAGYRRRSGALWNSTAVNKVLLRARNCGALVWGGAGKGNPDGAKTSVTVEVPRILSPERFAELRASDQRRRLLNGKVLRDSPYALAGLLRCGHCGYTLTGSKSKSPRGKTWMFFYICQGNTQRGKAFCAFRYYNQRRLEAAVVDALLSAANAEAVIAAIPPALLAPARDLAGEQRDVQRELDHVQRELQETYRLYRAGAIASELQLRDLNAGFLARQQAAQQRLAALDQEIAAERGRRERISALPRRVRTLREAWDATTVQVRKGILQELLQGITVWSDGRIALRLRL